MYRLSEIQIEFILNDIKVRGVEMEDLQLNLLDHICCIIESELDKDGDFEDFYQRAVKRFFKAELKEIEEETIQLLTFKNFYIMKKTLFITGSISVFAFIAGSIFKIMHWPGANVMLVIGTALLSLIFLPLMFIIKTRDKTAKREKIVVGVGSLIGTLLCLAVLFKVMHWPAGNGLLWFLAIGLAVFVLIPLYFFTGIRNPETKVNTTVTSIVLVGASALLFSMVNVKPSSRALEIRLQNHIQSEELLHKMHLLTNTGTSISDSLEKQINANCEEMKELILDYSTKGATLQQLRSSGNFMEEADLGLAFYDNQDGVKLFEKLKELTQRYNVEVGNRAEKKIPTENSILNIESEKIGRYSNYTVLESLVKLQMHLALN